MEKGIKGVKRKHMIYNIFNRTKKTKRTKEDKAIKERDIQQKISLSPEHLHHSASDPASALC